MHIRRTMQRANLEIRKEIPSPLWGGLGWGSLKHIHSWFFSIFKIPATPTPTLPTGGRGKSFVVITLTSLALLISPVLSAESVSFKLCESNTPCMLVGAKKVLLEPAFEDYSYMLEDACNAMSIKGDGCMIFSLMGPVGFNAMATVINGDKVIVYDRRLSGVVGGDGAEAIIAHELGHHFCKHVGKVHEVRFEIEADVFAGAAMKRMSRPLVSALSYAEVLSENSTGSHPSRNDRIAALTKGWTFPETASDCLRG